MSYAALDVSVQDAQPVLLFMFLRGSSSWYYCAGNESFTYGGHTYTPVPLLPGSFSFSGDIPKDTLDIELPISNALAIDLLQYIADLVTTLTVYRAHRGDAEARVIWKGRVLRWVSSGNTVRLISEPVFSSLRRLGLQQTYQRLCRRVLGGVGCNVTIANYSALATVTAIDGNKVTFSAVLTADYTGGTILAPDNTRRTIVSVGSNYVVLMRPVQSLIYFLQQFPAGFVITLYQGCDRSTTMCAARFNNIGNFGGFPGIPWINPMTNISSVFT